METWITSLLFYTHPCSTTINPAGCRPFDRSKWYLFCEPRGTCAIKFMLVDNTSKDTKLERNSEKGIEIKKGDEGSPVTGNECYPTRVHGDRVQAGGAGQNLQLRSEELQEWHNRGKGNHCVQKLIMLDTIQVSNAKNDYKIQFLIINFLSLK